MAKISIIVPVYNVADYLPQCLDSICNQTFTDFEVIIVNDGSTDNSLAICESYAQKDSRIKIISQPNGGLSAAKNTGMKYITSEYFTFVDSDDWIDLNMMGKLYEHTIHHDKNIDLVICDYLLHNENGPFKPQIKDPTIYFYNLNKYDHRLGLAKYLENARVASWAKLYRTAIYKNIKFPAQKYEDMYIYMFLIHLANNICIMPDKLYNYRFVRPGSIMNEYNRIKTSKMELDNYYTNIKFITEVSDYLAEFPQLSLKFLIKRYKKFYQEFEEVEANTGISLAEKYYIPKILYQKYLKAKIPFNYKLEIILMYHWPKFYRWIYTKL